MIRHARPAAVCAATIAALAVSFAAAEAASQINIPTQTVNRMTAAYSTKEVKCDTSQTTLLTRKITTKNKGNLSAHFQAEFGSGGGCDARIFLKMDGKAVPGPGQIAQGHDLVAHSGAINNLGEQTNGFVWAVKNVAAGKHTLQVMCLCDANSVNISQREVVFYHR